MGMSFLLPFFFVLGDGVESTVDLSLSCEESGRVLICYFDSNVSISCRFGLLDYYWVHSSTWLAFVMVGCCALSRSGAHSSRRSSARTLFSEVSCMSSLLDLPLLPFGWKT